MKARIVHIHQTHLRRRWLVAILVLVGLSSALAIYQWQRMRQIERPPEASSADPQQRQVAAVDAGASVPASAASIAASTNKAIESHGDAVDRLVRTGKPEDAFAAFSILHACVEARQRQAFIAQLTDPEKKAFWSRQPQPQPEVRCATLSPGQLTMRKQLIVKAGLAGVKDSYSYLSQIYHLDPELKGDPEILEAMPRVIEAAVRAGDSLAIAGRAAAYDACQNSAVCERDPYKALVMETAYRMIIKAEGHDLGTKDAVTPRLVKELGESRAREAIDEGRDLAFKSKGIK